MVATSPETGWLFLAHDLRYLNGMMALAAHNATLCYGQGDHAGAPEFSDRGNELTGGGSGGGAPTGQASGVRTHADNSGLG